MAVCANNKGLNNEQEQLHSKWNPGIEVQYGYAGSPNIQGITQSIRGTNGFISSRTPRDKNNTEDRDRMDIMVELKRKIIHQRQIPGCHWGAGNKPYKIMEDINTMDTDGEEKERRRKDTKTFPTEGGEATI